MSLDTTLRADPVASVSAAPAIPTAAPAAGRFRWIVLLLAWGSYLMSSVDRFAWGSLSLRAQGDFGLPLAQLASFVTAYFVGYIVSNCVSGILTDRLGPRLALSAAVIGTGLMTAVFGLTPSYWVGMAMQFGMGLATGADYAACIKILTVWFRKAERGRALGLWFTATSLGVVVANSVAPALAASSWGWRGAYSALGLVTAGLGVLCLVMLRDAPPAAEGAATTPVLVGALLRNRNLVLVSVAGFGALWATWGFTFSANTLMVKGAGLNQVTAAAIVATFGVGGLIAKPLIGMLSDWLGGRRKWPAICTLAAFVAMLLLFSVLRSEPAFFIAGPLLGVTAFVYSPLLAAMVAESVPRTSTGTASGFSNALWQLGGVIVPVTIAYAFSVTQSFTLPFIILALGPVLGVVCLLGVREVRHAVD